MTAEVRQGRCRREAGGTDGSRRVAPKGATVSINPRTPVLVGTGQFSNRTDRGEPVLEPADLMAEALRRADADTGVGASSVRTEHSRV